MESLAFDPGTSSNRTTRLVADLVSFQNFRKWIDLSSKHHWCEDFHSLLLSYLDSCHILSQEDKLECLQKLLMELEIEQEENETKTHETLLVDSEQYKAGYQTAMAHCYKYYDLRPKVSTPRFILPVENEFSASKQPSCQNTSVVKKLFYDIDNVNSQKEPFKDDLIVGHKEVIVVSALKDPFAALLESSMEMSYVMFKHGNSFRWWNNLSYFSFDFMTGGAESKLQSRNHLLDWLYWKYEIT
jgi:hypothetical protein